MTHTIEDPDGNGGILARFGKYSWSLVLIGLIGGPISTFFMMRETMTVGLNAAEIRITALEAENKELKSTQVQLQSNVVPRQEHEAVEAKQREIDHWKEKYYDEELKDIKGEIDFIRKK